jgi:hypothetical protein
MFRTKCPESEEDQSSTDVEDHLNGKLHLIQAHEGKATKDCAFCSNRKVKGGRRETSLYCDTCPRKPGLHPNKCFAIYYIEEMPLGM